MMKKVFLPILAVLALMCGGLLHASCTPSDKSIDKSLVDAANEINSV